jgi:hypothetical protein
LLLKRQTCDLTALHYRKRCDVWHSRGSVGTGAHAFPAHEFWTGYVGQMEAEAVGAADAAGSRASCSIWARHRVAALFGKLSVFSEFEER